MVVALVVATVCAVVQVVVDVDRSLVSVGPRDLYGDVFQSLIIFYPDIVLDEEIGTDLVAVMQKVPKVLNDFVRILYASKF